MAKRFSIKLILVYVILTLISVYANETGRVIYDFTKEEYNWVGENENLDYLNYNPDEEAYEGKLYNMGWATRYGGVAIQGNELNLSVSANKNRFIKLMVKADEIGAENAFDKLTLLYWYKGEQNVTYGTVKPDVLSGIHGSSDYITITFDLGWTNEEEKVIDKFRMDMFSSSFEKAATSTDGGQCGLLYIKYIAFFDTKELADTYELVVPTKEPATPTPVATVTPSNTPVSTENRVATPANGKNDTVNYMPIILIAGVVFVALTAVILIIFIPKGRKGK